MTTSAIVNELSWREATLIRQMNGDTITTPDFRDAVRLKEIGIIEDKGSGLPTLTDLGREVAKALSEVEQTDEGRNYWNDRFIWALENGALPAGRIISNAGAQAYKPATSTINCTVSGSIEDSMNDILEKEIF